MYDGAEDRRIMMKLSAGQSSSLAAAVVLFGLVCALALVQISNGDIHLNNTCAFGNNYIQIAGFACIEADERARNPLYDGAWSSRGTHNIKAFTLINRNMNRIGILIGNVTYCSNFTIVHSGCDGDQREASFARTVARNWAQRADFFISDHGTTLSPPAMIEVNAAQKLIFNPMSSTTSLYKCIKSRMDAGLQPECLAPGDRRFPWAFSSLVPVREKGAPVIVLFKLAKVSNVGIWHLNQSYPHAFADGAAASAVYNGLPMKRYVLPLPATTRDYENLVAQLKADKMESMVGAADQGDCLPLLRAMRKHNYFPKAAFQLYCSGEPGARELTPDAQYMLDSAEFDARMGSPSWTDNLWYPPRDGKSSARLVYEDLETTFNEPAQWSEPMVMSAGLVLHKLLQERGTLNQLSLRNALVSFSAPTFAGRMAFDEWGQNDAKDVLVVQADSNWKLQLVYPMGSATSVLAFPAPTFDERVFDSRYMHTDLEAAFAIVIGVLIFISLCLLLFVAFFHNHPHLLAASPAFLITILIGSMILYCTYFAWTLIATTATCHLRIWLLGLGFVLMYSALLAKTYRVMQIFTSTALRVYNITNLRLFIKIIVLLTIEIALLVAWSAASRPSARLLTVDPLRASKNRLLCTTSTISTIFLALLAAYKLIIVLSGIYMTFRIWKIPRKEFNESRSLAFSMYNVLIIGTITFALQASNVIDDPAMFVVRTCGIGLSTLLTVLAIFIPKLRTVITNRTGYSTSSSSQTSNSMRMHSVNSQSYARHSLISIPPPSERPTAAKTNQDASTTSSSHEAHETKGIDGTSPKPETQNEESLRLQQQLEHLNEKYDALRKKYDRLKAKAQNGDATGGENDGKKEVAE